MLDENEIVAALCAHLQTQGYEILQRCLTTERGTDVVAKRQHESGRLLCEAKGETSAREGSNRYAKSFNRSQVFDRVAKGFYTAACMRFAAKPDDTVALAFPDTVLFREFVDRIKGAAEILKMKVYLVNEQRSVTLLLDSLRNRTD